jgi:hypothetical protein
MPKRKPGVPAVWLPELVGKVPGYPKTQESFDKKQNIMRQQVALYNAEGITGRNGVPDGWAGRKNEINRITTAAKAEARAIVADLIKTNKFQPDNDKATIALEAAIAIIEAEKVVQRGDVELRGETKPVRLYSEQTYMAAIKTVLDFTQRKPVSQSQVALAKAEDFLDALAAKS